MLLSGPGCADVRAHGGRRPADGRPRTAWPGVPSLSKARQSPAARWARPTGRQGRRLSPDSAPNYVDKPGRVRPIKPQVHRRRTLGVIGAQPWQPQAMDAGRLWRRPRKDLSLLSARASWSSPRGGLPSSVVGPFFDRTWEHAMDARGPNEQSAPVPRSDAMCRPSGPRAAGRPPSILTSGRSWRSEWARSRPLLEGPTRLCGARAVAEPRRHLARGARLLLMRSAMSATSSRSPEATSMTSVYASSLVRVSR